MTEQEVRLLFLKKVRQYGTYGMAEILGVSQPYVCRVASGKKSIGPKILNFLNLKRIVSYE